VEMAVRALYKMSEKFEEAQMDIRRLGGVGKLVELQTKSKCRGIREFSVGDV